MVKAIKMFEALGYELVAGVGEGNFQAVSEDRNTIIDVQVEKWDGRNGSYLKLSSEELKAVAEIILEMIGERGSYDL